MAGRPTLAPGPGSGQFHSTHGGWPGTRLTCQLDAVADMPGLAHTVGKPLTPEEKADSRTRSQVYVHENQ